jgi:DNA-binding MarR family transcriptional regulator
MPSLTTDRRGLPLDRLLEIALSEFAEQVSQGLAKTPYSDIRPAHECVLRNIDRDGTRLTLIADRARLTKQAVGEVASDLERRGYLVRRPDPSDGRAKIMRLTRRGRAAHQVTFSLVRDIERCWEQRVGLERIQALREALEAITAGR